MNPTQFALIWPVQFCHSLYSNLVALPHGLIRSPRGFVEHKDPNSSIKGLLFCHPTSVGYLHNQIQ
jgi:hypothetical protein